MRGRSDQQPRQPSITSPYAPDLEKVRVWLTEKLAARLIVEVIAAILSLLQRMRDINLELAMKVAHLKRRRPPSETLARLQNQLVLPLFDAPAPKKKRGSRATDRNNHPGRGELPAHLRRVARKNEIPPAERKCPACGAEMATVCFTPGCKYLDVVPAEFIVVETQDEVVECPNDHTTVCAEPPGRIVEDGKLGDALLVEAVCDKYLEHLPVERQATRFARAGVDVAPQTLGRGVNTTIDLLEPLAKAIEGERGPGILGTDASAIPILDPRCRPAFEPARCGAGRTRCELPLRPSGDSTACAASQG
jgi:transposase